MRSAGLILVFASSTAAAAPPEMCSELDRVSAYRAVLEMTIDPSPLIGGDARAAAYTVRTEVTVRLPNKMRLRVQAADRSMQFLYDGAWLDVEIGGERLRLDQKRTARPGRPFDLGYGARGMGLEFGADLIGSLRSMCTDFRFRAPRGGIVEGKLDRKKVIDELIDDPSQGLAAFLVDATTQEETAMRIKMATDLWRDLLGSMAWIRMTIDRETKLPTRIELGRSKTTVTATLNITEFQRSTADTFTTTSTLPARDITSEILDHQQKVAKVSITPQMRKRVKEALGK